MAALLALSQLHNVTALSTVVMANLLITFIAVYALRGIYFSLIEEVVVGRRVTAAAVGLISMIGLPRTSFLRQSPAVYWMPTLSRLDLRIIFINGGDSRDRNALYTDFELATGFNQNGIGHDRKHLV